MARRPTERFPDTTYGRSARDEHEAGVQAYESAKGDAMGEYYCRECGQKYPKRGLCPDCQDHEGGK